MNAGGEVADVDEAGEVVFRNFVGEEKLSESIVRENAGGTAFSRHFHNAVRGLVIKTMSDQVAENILAASDR